MVLMVPFILVNFFCKLKKNNIYKCKEHFAEHCIQEYWFDSRLFAAFLFKCRLQNRLFPKINECIYLFTVVFWNYTNHFFFFLNKQIPWKFDFFKEKI